MRFYLPWQHIHGFLLVAAICLPGTAAQAGNPVTEIVAGDIPQGTLGLGFGWRWGDSPYRGVDDIGSIDNENASEYDLMPFYLYEGKYLFAHGSTAGVHLFRNEHFALDAILSYRFDRLETERDAFFNGVEEREQTLDGGLRAAFKGDWGELSASWVTDTQDHHNGEEIDLTYRYRWQLDRWAISPFASYIYSDEDLTGYYYGVSPGEAREDLPVYVPGSATTIRAGVNTSYRWSKRMRLFANLAVDFLGSEVKDSPLVDEDVVPTAMVGLAYAFGNVLDDSGTSRRNPERSGEWSWRVNYGYTAEETFHTVHRGNIKRNDDVHTYLAGLTLGKLALDGRRIDAWGKISINRRLENGLQEDFWEINPYIMLKGTGYSPWSNREIFRYGFGYGFSYADKVPMVEQVKQEKRDRNTSHLLNYLEAQVDFPLRNMFGNRGWWKNCYAGLTLVHRSGIFGRVDLIGNVSGGSDVLTGHLECVR
jgi:outer membrane scaffolding protein for murein synthesis (MipA/OmpV family)